MKHKNSVTQVNIERDREIVTLYNRAKAIAGSPTTTHRICQIAANLPASQFYISDYWALRYIKDRCKGKRRRFRNRRKQTLYNALYDTYRNLSRRHEYVSLPMESVVDIALSQPAPFIGISPDTIHRLLSNRLNIYQYDVREK